jgi:hypothetical protein
MTVRGVTHQPSARYCRTMVAAAATKAAEEDVPDLQVNA